MNFPEIAGVSTIVRNTKPGPPESKSRVGHVPAAKSVPTGAQLQVGTGRGVFEGKFQDRGRAGRHRLSADKILAGGLHGPGDGRRGESAPDGTDDELSLAVADGDNVQPRSAEAGGGFRCQAFLGIRHGAGDVCQNALLQHEGDFLKNSALGATLSNASLLMLG